jgi:hypothetical protein
VTRRDFLAAIGVALIATPLIRPAVAYEPEEEDDMASLMATLLDLSDAQYHTIDATKRHLLMAALYEAWGDDPEVVKLLAQSVMDISAPRLRELHAVLKAKAQTWFAAL